MATDRVRVISKPTNPWDFPYRLPLVIGDDYWNYSISIRIETTVINDSYDESIASAIIVHNMTNLEASHTLSERFIKDEFQITVFIDYDEEVELNSTAYTRTVSKGKAYAAFETESDMLFYILKYCNHDSI